MESVCKKYTCKILGQASSFLETCFFCAKQAQDGKCFSNHKSDANVRQYAL